MTTTFEPSNDLALISLIGLVKKMGFTYNTSPGRSWSSGVRVRKPYSYNKDEEDVFTVLYENAGNDDPDKLCAVAQALMDKGLGVVGKSDGKDNLSCLRVFAYDETAALEAYKAALIAQAREEAKVTPEVKAERIRNAQEYLAEQTREALDKLWQLSATTKLMFETLEGALANGDADLATRQAQSLEKMGERYGGDFGKLTWAMSAVKGAQDNLERCERLELRATS